MVSTLRSEYVGFTVNETARVYKVRVRGPDGIWHYSQIAIPNQSFLSNRVRYQDAAEICFLKLLRELSRGNQDCVPASHIEITEAELEEYREAHTKKPTPPLSVAATKS
ncbi:MAG TPA: hypothetical protein VEK15_12400 [Vicinamibacteria bacterium]|nr:hypothetical protein [Vicinamibacteria bacterium]